MHSLALLCIAAVLGISLYTTRYSPTARATRTAVAAGKTATAEYLTLFHDDFSDANSGWGSLEGENGTANYADGGYRINITAPDWWIWTTLPDVFQNDVQIEVDASRIDGAGRDYYGILCRYQDEDNYYYFAMSSNGSAAIEKIKQGDFLIISSDDDTGTEVASINHGNATNHLRADCVGDTLTLFINGEEALSAVDGEFTSGGIGLKVGTGSDGQSDILFKNFYVYRP